MAKQTFIKPGDHLPASNSSTQDDRCECGGKIRYYDGALGYEAMVCQSCGEHWNDQSRKDYEEHVDRYRNGVRQ